MGVYVFTFEPCDRTTGPVGSLKDICKSSSLFFFLVIVGRHTAEGDASTHRCRGVEVLLVREHMGLNGCNEVQDPADHIHYLTANGESGGHLPLACVPRVDLSMGHVR